MILPDVNVLVYAHREDVADHPAYHEWLQNVVDADEAFGTADIVLSGFIRVVTHPKVFKVPSTLSEALTFANQLRSQPHHVRITASVRHWQIFNRLSKLAVKPSRSVRGYKA